MTFLNRAPNFSMWECKRNETNLAEEYCWAMTQAAGRSFCGRSGASVVGLGFKLDSAIYVYIHTHVHTYIRVIRHCQCRRHIMCRMTDHIPKQVLQTVRSSEFSFNFEYLLVSLKSFSSCLRLLRRIPIPSIFLSVAFLEGRSYSRFDQSS